MWCAKYGQTTSEISSFVTPNNDGDLDVDADEISIDLTATDRFTNAIIHPLYYLVAGASNDYIKTREN